MWCERDFQAADPLRPPAASETRRNRRGKSTIPIAHGRCTNRPSAISSQKRDDTRHNQVSTGTRMPRRPSIDLALPERMGFPATDPIPFNTRDKKGKRPADAPPPCPSPRKRPNSLRRRSRKPSGGAGSSRVHGGGDRQDDEDEGDESEGPGDDPTASPGGDRYWACPFYKWKPYKYYRCHGKYELRRPGDVKLHMLRCHSLQQYYCQNCWEDWRDLESWEAHHRPPGGCITTPRPDELAPREAALLKTMPRGLKELDKWYWMWDTLFPGHQPPDSPYVVEGIGEPATVIYRDVQLALERELPRTIQETLSISMSSSEAALVAGRIFSLVSTAPQNEPLGPRTRVASEDVNVHERIPSARSHAATSHSTRRLGNMAIPLQYLEYHAQDQIDYEQNAGPSNPQHFHDVPQVTVDAPTEPVEDFSTYEYSQAGSYDVHERYYLNSLGLEDMSFATSPVSDQNTFFPERFDARAGSEGGGSLMQRMEMRPPTDNGEPPFGSWQDDGGMMPGHACFCGTGMPCDCFYRYH
ncbi:unnamed protein product [Clonostachys rhizophaga]|uniref:C2H2-type domain-containing protein n=1 Tax=Clonostachys rhizophaga TaxID=160324 RepID=A0A9N9YSA5_9HYPO|nr:unnamed protein product [Clonostachys rhizophaga]